MAESRDSHIANIVQMPGSWVAGVAGVAGVAALIGTTRAPHRAQLRALVWSGCRLVATEAALRAGPRLRAGARP